MHQQFHLFEPLIWHLILVAASAIDLHFSRTTVVSSFGSSPDKLLEADFQDQAATMPADIRADCPVATLHKPKHTLFGET